MNWTDHAIKMLKERQISKRLVESALNNPDEIVEGKHGRMVYHKLLDHKLLRVIVENNIVITVYLTDKVEKYWRGGKNL